MQQTAPAQRTQLGLADLPPTSRPLSWRWSALATDRSSEVPAALSPLACRTAPPGPFLRPRRTAGRRGVRSDSGRTWRVERPVVSGSLKRSHTDEAAPFIRAEVLSRRWDKFALVNRTASTSTGGVDNEQRGHPPPRTRRQPGRQSRVDSRQHVAAAPDQLSGALEHRPRHVHSLTSRRFGSPLR
jgi:hypothetical protein